MDTTLTKPQITTTPEHAQRLIDAFEAKTAHIAVVGLGYVGLPLAVETAKAGFTTYGFDVSERRVAVINGGSSPVQDIGSEEVAELVEGNLLIATTDASTLSKADAVVICVPTPLQSNKEPDMSYIVSAAQTIAANRKPGQLVVLESTSYPGTTDDLIAGILKEAGAEIDTDAFLAFSPERVDPGNRDFKTKNIPKVVGGVSRVSAEVAVAFYSQFLDNIHPVTSARVAETAKLLENTFRAVNIAMVNELAQICHELKIDVWEVVDAAKTKPFGFMAFYPGPGVGGHCIPLDPHYLAWSARLTGFEPRFIQIADQVNSSMPRYVTSRITELLNDKSKPLRGSNILVFGVAYKSDIDDARESPALEVMHLLEARGANLRYVDPFVSSADFKDHHWERSELGDDLLAWADAGVILTTHSAFDWEEIIKGMGGPVLDTRNAVPFADSKVVKL